MPRERRRDADEKRTEERDRARETGTDDRTDVDWERGSGGIEPGVDAVPRPRAPRVSGSTPSAEAPDPDEAVPSGDEDVAEEQTPEPGVREPNRESGSERRYGAASRRQSGDAGDERRGGRDERRGGGRTTETDDRARAPAGESTRERVGRPGNRRSRVGDTDTGSPHAGSQRGSERETGVAGRVGGQFGGDRTDAAGDRSDSDAPDQFGGQRGGDRRDRRYGSRRGHGTQRRDRRTE